MMRKLTLLASLVLMVTVIASPAFAMLGMKHHVTGNVTAIDPDTKTFTVTQDKSQKTFTFAAKDRAMFSNIKKGDHVRVAYTKQGTQLTAESVAAKAPSRTAAGTVSK